MEEGRRKGDIGNERDGTGHGVGRGGRERERERRKGREREESGYSPLQEKSISCAATDSLLLQI